MLTFIFIFPILHSYTYKHVFLLKSEIRKKRKGNLYGFLKIFPFEVLLTFPFMGSSVLTSSFHP